MRIDRPIIVLGAPRAGTSVLFLVLSSHPRLWSLYSESHFMERWVHPARSSWMRGNALDASDASEEVKQTLTREFYRRAVNLQICGDFDPAGYNHKWRLRVRKLLIGFGLSRARKPEVIRLVEKTPKNCLRVSFLDALFPDAHYVFITRDPRSNIGSLIEGWRTPGQFRTYEVPGGIRVDGCTSRWWHFLLPPGWEEYARGGRTLAEVCAFQYRSANDAVLRDLAHVPQARQTRLRYEDLIADSRTTVHRICDAAGIAYEGGLRRMAEDMPVVNSTGPADENKWRKHEKDILAVLPNVRDVATRLGYEI